MAIGAVERGQRQDPAAFKRESNGKLGAESVLIDAQGRHLQRLP
jgi:hypothetical protein